MSLSDTGYYRPTYSEILAEQIQNAKKLFGNDIDVSSTSPLGKFIRIGAYDLSKVYEDLEAVYYARFPNTATGTSLDRLCVFAGIKRNPATFAMHNIKVTGTANAVIDSIVIRGTNSDITFSNTKPITLNESGTAEVIFICSERGTDGNITEINNIVTPVADVQGVEYVSTYQYGDDTETDTALRKRFKIALEGAGGANINGIRAEVMKVPTVKSVSVINNNTNETVDNRPPHSYEVYVYGGENYSQAIAQAIFDKAPIGIQSCSTTSGATPVKVRDDAGVEHDIYFSHTANIAINVDIIYNKNLKFPSDGKQQMINVVKEYINSLGVGENVIKSAIYPYLMSVQGVTDILDIALSANGAGSDLLSGNIVIKNNQVAQPGNISATYIDDDDVAILG